MTKDKIKDILKRTAKTFAQGYVAAVTITPAIFANVKDIDTLWKVLCPLLIAGVAGGVCAVWNFIGKLLEKDNEDV